jgi:hypothetical protein
MIHHFFGMAGAIPSACAHRHAPRRISTHTGADLSVPVNDSLSINFPYLSSCAQARRLLAEIVSRDVSDSG